MTPPPPPQPGTPLRVGSLFSGYGGLDQAVRQVLGGDLAWVSDIDPGACAVLAHHHPDVPNLGDVSAVDWTTVEPVDVLAGGFPCTDVSSAGRREGLRAGTRSGLWTQMARAIDELRPPLVVIENVRGLCSAAADSDLEPCPWCVGDDEGVPLRALGCVLGDLADLGYDARWCGLRAADVGAPHGRYRIFIVATDTAGEGRRQPRGVAPGPAQGVAAEAVGPAGRGGGASAAHPDRVGRERPGSARDRGSGPADHGVTVAHSAGDGHGHAGPARVGGVPAAAVAGAERDAAADAHRGGLGTDQRDLRAGQPDTDRCAAADPDGEREQQRQGHLADVAGRADDGGAPGVDWREYGPAVARWGHVLGRPAPNPTESGRRGQPVLSPAFVEWLMGLPAGHVTAVPGLSRNQQLRLLGNGVVPAQGAAAIAYLFAHLSAAAAA